MEDEPIIIQLLTYNTCARDPQQDFAASVCPDPDRPLAHVVGVAIQEIDKSLSGASDTCFLQWKAYLSGCLTAYRLEVAQKAAGTALFLFSTVPLEGLEVVSKRITRGCKGAIGASFVVNSTLVLVVAAHMMHDMSRLNRRNQQYHEIVRLMAFRPLACDPKTRLRVQTPRGFHDHDVVFWAGDLNYRMEAQLQNADGSMLQSSQFEYQSLMQYEQLHRVIVDGTAFSGFDELKISFGPTYKYADAIHYDIQRVPSWCDRVLFWERGAAPRGDQTPSSGPTSELRAAQQSTPANLSEDSSQTELTDGITVLTAPEKQLTAQIEERI